MPVPAFPCAWITSTSTTATTTTATTIQSMNWPMFIPTGAGALYYHSLALPQGTTASNVAWAQHQQAAILQNYTLYQNLAFGQSALINPGLGHMTPRALPLPRPALLSGRRALRRSVELYQRLRPPGEIRTFLEGKPITLRGHRFDYRVRKSRNLLEHTMNPNNGHVPYDLHILDAAGRPLAKGCIIAPDTPVIDQLLALALHVSDPEEEAIVINRTNWSPALTQRAGRHSLTASAHR